MHAFSVQEPTRICLPGVSRYALHTWLLSQHPFGVLIAPAAHPIVLTIFLHQDDWIVTVRQTSD